MNIKKLILFTIIGLIYFSIIRFVSIYSIGNNYYCIELMMKILKVASLISISVIFHMKVDGEYIKKTVSCSGLYV